MLGVGSNNLNSCFPLAFYYTIWFVFYLSVNFLYSLFWSDLIFNNIPDICIALYSVWSPSGLRSTRANYLSSISQHSGETQAVLNQVKHTRNTKDSKSTLLCRNETTLLWVRSLPTNQIHLPLSGGTEDLVPCVPSASCPAFLALSPVVFFLVHSFECCLSEQNPLVILWIRFRSSFLHYAGSVPCETDHMDSALPNGICLRIKHS